MASLDLRVLNLIRETGFWKRIGHVHSWIYKATGGRVGHSAGGITNLLLTTTGRRSGESRTVTLAYVADGSDLIVVASNGGSDRAPAWWQNLRANPAATVQVGGDRFDVAADEVTGGDRARLWTHLTQVNPFYSRYEQLAARTIPVVRLRRNSASPAR